MSVSTENGINRTSMEDQYVLAYRDELIMARHSIYQTSSSANIETFETLNELTTRVADLGYEMPEEEE